jgi:phospholipid-binding lipoprotein MlaA
MSAIRSVTLFSRPAHYAGTDNVDGRSQQLDTLDELQKNAIDFYAEIRSLSRQRRAIQLRHGEPGPYPKLDQLDQPQESAKAESLK